MYQKIELVKLSTDAINPRVLVSYLYTQGMHLPKGHQLPKRLIYDYELEFFTESDGSMYIDDILYPIRKGDLVFRRPGQYTQAIMPYCCYLISFDLSGKTAKYPENYNFCATKGNEFQDYYLHPILEPIPNVYHPNSTAKYFSLFDRALKEFINPSDTSPLLLKAYTLEILCHLSRDVRNPLNNHAVLQSPHGMVVKRTVDYIKTNLNASLRLESLAKSAGLSPTYFHKIFSDTMGVTLNDFITKTRLERAKELLIRTDIQVYKIAIECGFENIPYFTSLFKKHQGVSPAEFRKRYSYI